MKFSASFRSELFRARRMHVGLVLIGLYLGVALLYVYSVLVGCGAWVSVGAEAESQFVGFSAELTYLERLGIGCSEAERIVTASLAHTLLFPVAAVLTAGMFFDAPARGAADVSWARGAWEFGRFFARIAVCCLYLVAAYTVFSILLFSCHCAVSFGRFDTVASLLLAQRLAPNILVDMSFVVLCVSTFTLARVRALASGGLLVLVFAGLIVAMSLFPSAVPVHMAYWIRLCGTSMADVAPAVIVFSAVSSVLCVVAVGISLRFRDANAPIKASGLPGRGGGRKAPA